MTEALSHVQMALVVRANPDLRELNLSLAGFLGLGQEGSVKRTRFSEEQIIAILREAEAGAKLTDLGRLPIYRGGRLTGGAVPPDGIVIDESGSVICGA
jgi:hypothetical protein